MQIESFLDAVRSGDSVKVQDALVHNPELALARDPDEVTALMLALYHRRPEVAAAIRSHRTEIDVFEAAALNEFAELSEQLQRQPELTGARSVDGFTALHFAAFMDEPEAVETLLEAGADWGAVSDNVMRVSPLGSAVAAGANECARLLLAAGADANAPQAAGFRPLMAAAQQGNLPLIDLLLAHGGDPALTADDGRSAADFARARDDQAVLDRLKAANVGQSKAKS